MCNKVTQRRPTTPPVAYAPGFFTADLWPHTNWPYKGWKPQLGSAQEQRREAWHAALAVSSTAGVLAGKAKSLVLDGSRPGLSAGLAVGSAAHELMQRLMAQRIKAGQSSKRGAKP